MRTGPADTLPTTAQVVVIGGGIVGAAVAFHLARAGITDVVVVERDGLAGAASGKPIGGLRAQFSDRLNALLALRSLELYAELGADMDHRRVGYLFLLREARARRALRGRRRVAERRRHPERDARRRRGAGPLPCDRL